MLKNQHLTRAVWLVKHTVYYVICCCTYTQLMSLQGSLLCQGVFVPTFMLLKDKYFITLSDFMYCIRILTFYF